MTLTPEMIRERMRASWERLYAECLAAEMAKVNRRNCNAPENHPSRIAARASDQARAAWAYWERAA